MENMKEFINKVLGKYNLTEEEELNIKCKPYCFRTVSLKQVLDDYKKSFNDEFNFIIEDAEMLSYVKNKNFNDGICRYCYYIYFKAPKYKRIEDLINLDIINKVTKTMGKYDNKMYIDIENNTIYIKAIGYFWQWDKYISSNRVLR